MCFLLLNERRLKMCRDDGCEGLFFHTHRNATEMSVVFHQAVTGVDVSAATLWRDQ